MWQYFLRITWSDSERARWKARDQQTKTDTEKRQWIGEQPYTTEEKQWLKKHYGGEFKFLMAYEMSIYNEEGRAEGRAIMRALAKDDESNDGHEMEEDEEEEEEDEEDSDLDGHLADYHFSQQELDWIKKHYWNSATFMFSHGLRFYDNEDYAAAKRLLHNYLRE